LDAAASGAAGTEDTRIDGTDASAGAGSGPLDFNQCPASIDCRL
jgi:hypothetical protein